MKLVTGAEMKEVDRYSIEEIGISGLVLMENAGKEVAQAIIEFLGDLKDKQVIILAGKGNNGGDGFVISRLLIEHGIGVKTILLGKKEDTSEDAKVNLEILDKLGIEVQEIISKEETLALKGTLDKADLIVDALLGTGIKGELRGLYPKLITLVNNSPTSVIAVDIPSGVEADTGRVADIAIEAQETITFALPKIGTILYPGADFVGDLKVVDIGIPQMVIDKQDFKIDLITSELVNKLLPIRAADSHKGSYGKLLLVAGSTGMTGAATLATQASLRIGAGLVTLGTPRSLNPILENKLTEAMTYPLGESKEGVLSRESVIEIKRLLNDRDVLAIGPGLTANDEISYILNHLLEKTDKPMVVDADGLNVISDLNILKGRGAPTILTPHPGELSRLINKSIEIIRDNPIEVAKNFARDYNVTLVLKGARTIIATPQGQIYINHTGNSGLATGGSGDVLTGLISGLLVQGIDEVSATIIGVYLHGLAADLAAEDLTEYSLLPSDIIDYLPQSLKAVRSDK
ncbi:bifunctional ADP-dependent (S)-NAD(P)H-hydrate dehydratase/NAD(P)H-hydrate epimerase [Orenia metallireducens]|uniref:Bifunctional NAD(P)H-hydrate repair enzyme n=1 Tax=Orenia metallireducens TaxID=1413210 RepID=A0A1C0ABM6_9FIRM|nr:bifunctional ADP-dependent NAD(P)H-hydrate dehydratase/NAD(P)H-hydrate epimerase [Orenia metallireducens]OCL27770.1 bifunctional ADP-dependent (S)-NAD(P)H-hydrate dehydratase/NAD(P)H-hydrate epimerase [Orenia metallireducens]